MTTFDAKNTVPELDAYRRGLYRRPFSGGAAGCLLIWACLPLPFIGAFVTIATLEEVAPELIPIGDVLPVVLGIPALLVTGIVFWMLAPLAHRLQVWLVATRRQKLGWLAVFATPFAVFWALSWAMTEFDRSAEWEAELQNLQTLEGGCHDDLEGGDLKRLEACFANIDKWASAAVRRLPDRSSELHELGAEARSGLDESFLRHQSSLQHHALRNPADFERLERMLLNREARVELDRLSSAAAERKAAIQQRGLYLDLILEGSHRPMIRAALADALLAQITEAYPSWLVFAGWHLTDAPAEAAPLVLEFRLEGRGRLVGQPNASLLVGLTAERRWRGQGLAEEPPQPAVIDLGPIVNEHPQQQYLPELTMEIPWSGEEIDEVTASNLDQLSEQLLEALSRSPLQPPELVEVGTAAEPEAE